MGASKPPAHRDYATIITPGFAHLRGRRFVFTHPTFSFPYLKSLKSNFELEHERLKGVAEDATIRNRLILAWSRRQKKKEVGNNSRWLCFVIILTQNRKYNVDCGEYTVGSWYRIVNCTLASVNQYHRSSHALSSAESCRFLRGLLPLQAKFQRS